MSTSPDHHIVYNILQIDRSSDRPIYLQITLQISLAIQRGLLAPHSKLPGARSLSKQLNTHRQTVTSAFSELESQGWIVIIPNKGAFISSLHTENATPSTELPELFVYPDTTKFNYKRSAILDTPYEIGRSALLLDDGLPDIRLTKFRDISRFYTANLKRRINLNKQKMSHIEGNNYFRTQLAAHLHRSKGLPITQDNILVTRSTELSLFVIAEILFDRADTILVGDPSFFSANMLFMKFGMNIQAVPVDDEGLDTEAIERICASTRVKAIYFNPERHYPTTVKMSASRRMELLRIANTYGVILIEDDLDNEFRYEHTTTLPVVSSDHSGMVIYTSTFGKSLAPGFQKGFIVAPKDIILEMQKILSIIDRQGDVVMQQALGEMLEDGEIDRYLKKSTKTYQHRRDTMTTLLRHQLGGQLQFNSPDGGLALWVHWNNTINLMALSKKCKTKGLHIPKILLYQDRSRCAMRIGYGSLDEQEIMETCRILTESYSELSAIDAL